jgi:hypothetical protein
MQKDFSYSLNSNPFLLGNVWDGSLAQVDSYLAETAIPFGAPVVLGSDPTKQVKLATSTTSTTGLGWLGIALRQNQLPSGGVLAPDSTGEQPVIMSTSVSSYPIGSPVAIAKSGRVIVPVTTVVDAVVGTTRAVYTFATGKITTQNSAVTANTAIDLGFVLTVPVAGQLCAIQINKLLQ